MKETHARIWALVGVLLAAGMAASCSEAKSSKTTIPQSSRIRGHEGMTFKNLFVIGVGENEESRRLFEDAFAKVLTSGDTRAQPSWGILPQSTLLTEQELDAAVRSGDFDGVLITRLVGVDEEEQYVEGRSYSERHPRYRHYKGYYKGSYEVVHEPGYFKTKTTYRLETNLYAVSDGALVWSAQSHTVDPESIAEGIDSLTEAVAGKLREEASIPR